MVRSLGVPRGASRASRHPAGGGAGAQPVLQEHRRRHRQTTRYRVLMVQVWLLPASAAERGLARTGSMAESDGGIVNREKFKRVGKLLLAARRREGTVQFPFLSDLNGKKASRKSANKFMLCCILDYSVRAHLVVENATRFAEQDLGDPRALWHTIVGIPRWNSDAVRRRYAPLHPRFPKRGHARVGRIAREIVERYDGDARKIWRSQPPGKVLERLEEMNVGPKISRMIVGALYDTKQISGAGDLAPDIHIRRVLGRVFTGEVVSPDEALEIARKIRPRTSWKLDSPLWSLGKSRCKPRNPLCGDCYLQEECGYA